ncbi:hypothetical protein CS0771_07450 [Catellatospora sp. IY07-71]|nr:hypothetical protein CS0771_07450 [Catellatospora sp. IY07-71]
MVTASNGAGLGKLCAARSFVTVSPHLAVAEGGVAVSAAETAINQMCPDWPPLTGQVVALGGLATLLKRAGERQEGRTRCVSLITGPLTRPKGVVCGKPRTASTERLAVARSGAGRNGRTDC